MKSHSNIYDHLVFFKSNSLVGWRLAKRPQMIRIWHACKIALLKYVDGKVFHDISIKPKMQTLQETTSYFEII